MKKQISIFALAAVGKGISGGDRIFIEFARRWVKHSKINIYVWEEGYKMCLRQRLQDEDIKFHISKMKFWNSWGFFINYLARIIEGIKLGLSINLENNKNTVVYSSSEFWMDSLTTFILKTRFSKITWVAAWFQTAPNPFVGFAEGRREGRYRLKSLLYYLVQLPIKPLISQIADFVLVNNEEEKKQFPNLNKNNKAIVVLGAVNTKEIEKWVLRFKKLPKIYDAVFQGRFHPQKGVLELIDIWRKVVDQKNKAKLVMIGDGPLMEDVKEKIKRFGVEENIFLKGYLFDGQEKYKIFSQSKLVLHPSFYDSGGMAAAEAMAFGLPAVGFNLKSFQSYYPAGMVKVSIGDLSLFAKSILELLNSEKERKDIGIKALNMIKNGWSWDRRAEEVFNKI